MGVAMSLRTFFDAHPLVHDAIHHEHAESSQRAAAAAGRPGDKVAKGVLLRDEEGYLLAVLPATHRLHLGRLHRWLNRDLGLATEREVAQLFEDCEVGAIPPTGLLYDVETVVDESLLAQPDVYFEAGDHEQLIHMPMPEFKKLLGDAVRGRVSFRI